MSASPAEDCKEEEDVYRRVVYPWEGLLPSTPQLNYEWAGRDEPQGSFYAVGRVCGIQTMESLRSKESKGLLIISFDLEQTELREVQ